MLETCNKLVSIIIPCYNNGKHVAESIDSALGQTYKNTQIVIVNDGSSDNSNEIIKQYANKHKNIKYFNNRENRGVIYSRNMAIDASLGEYILPLDADDIIDRTYIEKAVNILDNKSDIGIVYCRANTIGVQNGQWKLKNYNKDDFLFNNCIFATSLFRKKDFIKAGKYKEYMKNGFEDWDLWLSFIELGLKPYRIDETLFYYRIQNENSRSTYANPKIFEAKKELLKHHTETYINNEKFLEKCFKEEIKPKNKYKKLFNIFLSVAIIELLLILLILIFKF